MKNNKKIIIAVIVALGVVLIIGTAAFAAGAAGRIFHRPDQTVSNKKDYIGEEKAKATALDHAGLTESEVTFIRTKLDYDDGIAEYEIEFYKDATEYDYNIDAITGEIRSYDSDAEGRHGAGHPDNSSAPVPDSGNTSPDSSSYIPESEAVNTALEHAGLSESDVSRLTVKFDYDDRQAEYEVEFYVDWTEYTYDINAVTGEIISYDKDIDD